MDGNETYEQRKLIISIQPLGFDHFTAPGQQEQTLWCFGLRDHTQPTLKLGDELKMNLMHLPKAAAWARLIRP